MAVISWILLAVFATISLGNAFTIFHWLVKRKHISAIPVIGGLAGCLGLLISGNEKWLHYWWVPLVLDYGTVPMFVHFFVATFASMLRGRE